MTKKQIKLLSDQVRDALNRHVAGGAESRYAMAHTLGISQSMLSRFANRKGALSMAYLDKLAAHLGLEITPCPRATK